MKKALILLFTLLHVAAFAQQKTVDSIVWKQQILINDQPVLTDPAGALQPGRRHGSYGSQYCRMLKLKDGSWLAGYTISRNSGYHNDPKGGLELQVSKSTDNGQTWQAISTISDPGRDLDNAQLIQLKDGSILLACRSVRWQEDYLLPVYKSADKGKKWTRLSIIDENHGTSGELGKPDKGIYEPHFYLLDDGRLAVMYANEKHVVENPSYSQIISEKISPDFGKSWGKEIWVTYTPGQSASRPGMPVWTKMDNSQYILVYEVCGPEGCNIFSKTSPNGIDWPVGIGRRIPDQLGGPYILALKNGTLVVTSNSSQISISNDHGETWKKNQQAWPKTLWGAIYQIGNNQVAVANSARRDVGGTNIQIRVGEVK